MMEKREKLVGEIRFLGRILGEVIKEQAGPTLYELEEEIRLGSRARREGRPGAERALLARIRTMSDVEARTVVRAFTIYFDLVNLAEDRERVRVLRERERSRAPEPRSESMEEAVLMMRRAGMDAERSQALLDILTIGLVFTAHPTEAKRRSVRTKVRLLRQSLVQLDDVELLPRERERLVTRMRSLLTALWQTDLIRPRRPSVLEEVEVGLYFAGTLWEVAPTIYAELTQALEKVYPGSDFRLPAFLGFGSWIGGDRDGNPHVSAAVTAQTLMRMRGAALNAHLLQCAHLFEELTTSEREAPVSRELRQALERRVREYSSLEPLLDPLSPHEIYRRWLRTVEWRLRRTREGESLERMPARRVPQRGRARRGPRPRPRQPPPEQGRPDRRGRPAGVALADTGLRPALRPAGHPAGIEPQRARGGRAAASPRARRGLRGAAGSGQAGPAPPARGCGGPPAPSRPRRGGDGDAGGLLHPHARRPQPRRGGPRGPHHQHDARAERRPRRAVAPAAGRRGREGPVHGHHPPVRDDRRPPARA